MSKPFYPPGCYRCRITGQLFTESSNGNPVFVLKFQVLECVEPVNDSFPQWERKAYFTVTEKTYERVIEDLRLIGFKGKRVGDADPDTPDFHNFTGREVEMHCTHDEDQNKELRERWNIRGENLKPLANKGKLSRLDEMFEKPKQPNGQAAVVAVNELGITEDDVPF